MAHFDVDGEIAPHARRHVEALREVAIRLVVVTTSQLTDEARDWLAARGELIERANLGYDFMSYKAGLEHAGDLSRYDEVVLCNDSFVGPLVSYQDVFAAMEDRRTDFWGMTRSDRIDRHLQSYFLVFRQSVVSSVVFRRFWDEMVPLPKRRLVIRKYEVGLTRRLREAGFALASYFEENGADRCTARRRVVWWAVLRNGGGLRALGTRRFWSHAREPWNPVAALADRALGSARLPLVKIDTLRFDPMGLGARRLLALCETEYPAAFEGVREFLARTRSRYPYRRGERLPAPRFPFSRLRRLVRYR